MICVSASLAGLTRRLLPISELPALDAQVLLAWVLNRSRAWLAAHPEARLDPVTVTSLESFVQRLEHGEPLPYILGEWEFFNLSFHVTPDVLIPRPETELLVERAIAWLRKWEMEHGAPVVLDVGTGCGCIAIALAVNVLGIKVVATDISPAALDVARRNAMKMNVTRSITFLEADLIPEMYPRCGMGNTISSSRSLLPPSFDMIVANLPYIPTAALHNLPVFTREPFLALDGGPDGLVLIRRLLEIAPKLLTPGGQMLLEIEASQGTAALSLAYDEFEQAEIHLHKDLAGKDRLLEIDHLNGYEVL